MAGLLIGGFLFGFALGALACALHVTWATRNDDKPKEPYDQ